MDALIRSERTTGYVPLMRVCPAGGESRYEARVPQATASPIAETSTSPQAEASFTLLGDLSPYGPEWRMTRPLPLLISVDGTGDVVVSERQFLVYGAGASLAEALEDYVVSLVEYYQLVAAGAARNPNDRRELGRLQAYLCELPSA